MKRSLKNEKKRPADGRTVQQLLDAYGGRSEDELLGALGCMDEEERAGMRAFARELAPMLSSAQKEKLAAVLQRLGMQEGQ